MELKMMAKPCFTCSSKATATMLWQGTAGHSLPQAVPEHTWRWHNLAHSMHPTGTNPELLHSLRPALPGYLHTKLSASEMLLFTSWDTHNLQKTESDTSQWPKGILSRNNYTFIVKCYDVRKVLLKIIWFFAILFQWLNVLHQHSGKNTTVTPRKIYLPFSSL